VFVVQVRDGDEITFAGQRGVFNNVSLDRRVTKQWPFSASSWAPSAPAIDIPLDAVKEFQVVRPEPPRNWTALRGIIKRDPKSGTNSFHGSLFTFQRLGGSDSNTSDGSRSRIFAASSWRHRRRSHQEGQGFSFSGVEEHRENLTRRT